MPWHRRREQFLESFLLSRLGAVVRGPLLGIGLALDGLRHRHRFGDCFRSVGKEFPLSHDPHRENVFANVPRQFVIGAVAVGGMLGRIDFVLRTVARLARHDPSAVLLDDANHRGQLNATLFPVEQFPVGHGHFSPVVYTRSIYR